MTTILVAPAGERRVVTPQGALVPDKFLIEPRDPYWARALRDGDIVPVDAAPAPVSTAVAPVSTEKK